MAEETAKRMGQRVHVGLFENMEWEAEFDAIWANASLLHVPRSAIKRVLTRTHRALKNGGRLYASFKSGTGEGRDGLGRYYNYPSRSELTAWMKQSAGWREVKIEEGKGGGYDKKSTAWLHLYAVR